MPPDASLHFQNWYVTRLREATDATSTTIYVDNPPAIGSGILVLEGKNASKREIIYFSSVSGYALQDCVRGLEGTVPNTHNQGATIEQAVTAGQLDQVLSPHILLQGLGSDQNAAMSQDAVTRVFTKDHNTDGTHKRDSILSLVYPVGSLYFNATNGTNPGTLLGFGTWVAFGAGRVPVGFNSSDSSFNSAEKTGGAKTHTLTAAQMPSHDHEIGASGQSFVVSGNPGPSQWASGSAVSSSFALRLASRTSTAGSGSAHNNLQPYITVYIWKRVL